MARDPASSLRRDPRILEIKQVAAVVDGGSAFQNLNNRRIAFATLPQNTAAPVPFNRDPIAMNNLRPTPEWDQPAVRPWRRARLGFFGLAFIAILLPSTPARASMFQGEALDTMANVLSWVVLVVAPIVGIAVFWLVHILPEKIAEKRQHPQAKAIQCLCLLSLVFGGLLWPIAWLWAFSKPVLYKLAYGTDKVAHGQDDASPASPGKDETAELKQLRQRVAELESKPGGKAGTEGGKA